MRRALLPLLLAGVLAGAAAVRAAGLGLFPIQDESQTVATALFLEATGAPSPPEANWPPLTYTLLRGILRASVALGLHPSRDAVEREFAERWYRETRPLHFEVRAMPLACGIGLVGLAYLLGRRLGGRGAGLLAALGVAFSPLAVEYSRFALTDAPHALATTASLLLALVAYEGGGRGAFLGSCALAGVAFSTKYLGGLALLAAGASLWLRRPRPRFGAAASECALGAAAFLAASFAAAPSMFLHPAPYLGWLRKHGEATAWEWLGFEGEPRGWVYHLTRTIPWAFGGIVLCAVALLGLAVLVKRDPRRAGVLLAFAVPFYAVVGANRILFARYLLPLVPVLAALAAVGLTRGLREVLPGPRLPLFAGAALGLLGFGGAIAREADRARTLRRPDTRRVAAKWMEENLPSGALVLTAVPFAVPGFEFLPNSAYPAVAAKRFEWGNLLHSLDRRMALGFEEARGRYDFYVETSFVDGLLTAKAGRYPEYAAFARGLEKCATVASFEPGGAEDPLVPRAELESLTVVGKGCENPGPRIRIARLR